jgi:cytochrome c-type biogenesis protein CcmE
MANGPTEDEEDYPPLEEPEPSTEEDAVRPKRTPKGISERRIKVIAVVAIIAVVVIVVLWGMVPERIYEVREAVTDLDSLEGSRINIKGVVVNWDSKESNFTLADSNNENLTILIHHSGPFPEGFGINATAVVRGILKKEGQDLRFESEEIQIGCPSKY